MKSLMLIGALLFAPVVANEEVEPEKVEVETKSEETNYKEIVEKLIEDNEWLKQITKTCGVIYGVLGGSSFGALLIVSIKAIVNAVKNKRIKNETLEGVKDAVLKEVEKTVGEQIANQIKEPLGQLVDSIKGISELQVVLGKIIALSQEDSYKARLAILECIAGLHIVDVGVLEDAKKVIEEEEKDEKDTIEETNNAIDEIIEDTEDNKKDDYGLSI